MNRVASIANDINHHPDIAVLDKRSVRVTAWTRKLGYLTDIDFDLAASSRRCMRQNSLTGQHDDRPCTRADTYR